MSHFPIFHGITLADQSYIENMHIELLAADPVPVLAGRIWFNTTDKLFKMSTLDAGNAVVVRSFVDSFALAAVQSELDATQAGAGLATDGTYSAHVGSNFIDAATSLHNADLVLDGAVKAEETARIAADNALDGRVTTIESDYIKKDGSVAFTGNIDAGGFRVVNAADGIGASDLVTKSQLDSVSAGLDVKDPVRVATTGVIADLSGDDQAGTSYVIDGITLVSGDRVLVKDTASPDGVVAASDVYNGIYTVSISTTGSPGSEITTAVYTRSSDADNTPTAEVSGGMFVFVEVGTENANNGYVLTSVTGTAVLGTDPLVFAQFSAAGTILAGQGLSKSGNTINVNAGDGIEIIADEVAVKLDGTTLASSATGLKVADATIQRITDLEAEDVAIQSELDATQAGAGLGTDGTYTANGGANYISTATSLFNADQLLDAQVKANADAIAALGTGNLAALQAELDATQAGAGLATDGTYITPVASNYIDTAISLYSADDILDAAIKAEENARIAGDAAIKSAFNALRFTYESPTADTTHIITHNLGNTFVDFTVLVQRDNLEWRNDVVSVAHTDNNTLTVYLSNARKVRVSVTSMAPLV